ncbi:N(G),N(G)-dimethylarginine dimethylaminohydrolase 1 [Ditylenchus destructor]|uniref:N(G),N(G)-dimethylarginine dimethylaminohydrolase 1 n=1 Tax=Ditylenchus destructor TaxID=166010 RepID=A0AAD4RBF1_9BILA|nr:N(G),N(G)-dimethylarginine dimethylaminohydrolase 1 [Ditylenchus destructor]
MKFTHAVVVKIPRTVKFEDKKTASKIDFELARKQQEDLNDTLREAHVELVEIFPEENCAVHSLFVDDSVVFINGTALITRPKKGAATLAHLLPIVRELAWNVVETPQQEHGKTVVLEGSDVLFTGKEIFVGIRKNGTNTEGALVLARVFPEFSVVGIPISSHNIPLKQSVSVAATDVLVVSKGKDSQAILKRIERDATFRYKVLTVESDEATNCINVNDHLIFRHDLNEMKFRVLQQPTELWGVTIPEMLKIGAPMSRFCLLLNKIKPGKV